MNNATASWLAEERLTHLIIGAFFRVYNQLGFGFLEHVYAAALELELLGSAAFASRANTRCGSTTMGQSFANNGWISLSTKKSFWRTSRPSRCAEIRPDNCSTISTRPISKWACSFISAPRQSSIGFTRRTTESRIGPIRINPNNPQPNLVLVAGPTGRRTIVADTAGRVRRPRFGDSASKKMEYCDVDGLAGFDRMNRRHVGSSVAAPERTSSAG